MVFAPLPSLFSCAAQMQNSLPYLEIAAMVFLLNVVILFSILRLSGENLEPSFEMRSGLLFGFGIFTSDKHNFVEVTESPRSISARLFSVGDFVLAS